MIIICRILQVFLVVEHRSLDQALGLRNSVSGPRVLIHYGGVGNPSRGILLCQKEAGQGHIPRMLGPNVEGVPDVSSQTFCLHGCPSYQSPFLNSNNEPHSGGDSAS